MIFSKRQELSNSFVAWAKKAGVKSTDPFCVITWLIIDDPSFERARRALLSSAAFEKTDMANEKVKPESDTPGAKGKQWTR